VRASPRARRWLRWIALVATGLVLAATSAVAVAVRARPYDPARLARGDGSSLVLTDRQGRPLRTLALAGGGRARWVDLDRLPAALIAATLAGEDHRFFEHHGVDGLAVARAIGLDARAGHAVSGASTITMQLARLLQPHPRTLPGKLGEIVDALRLERAASKQTILEQYLNRAYYGDGAFGVEMAAARYFGKSAAALSDGEATWLAVLPRAPQLYNLRRSLEQARARRAHVLTLMQARGWLDDERRRRIEAEPIALVETAAPQETAGPLSPPRYLQPPVTLAPVRRGEGRGEGSADEKKHSTPAGDPLTLTLSPEDGGEGTGKGDGRFSAFRGDTSGGSVSGSAPAALAPHFTDWVLAQLPGDARARGGTIRTTLDLTLQTRLEQAVRDHLAARATPGLQAGLVVLDPIDGSVRALVGSADPTNPRAGQVDIVTTRRHPGSTLKPFLYALALEQGETPASIAHDTRAGVPGFHPRHVVHEHGAASLRDALAGSYNLAAVDVLGRVGLPQALERLRRAGLGPLEGTTADYGLDLALGAPRVRLIDLAAAYSFLIDGGNVVRPRFLADAPPVPAVPLYTAEASWLTLDLLADPQARRATFGADLPLDLPFPVAAKTGTSSGFADTVAVAATREAIVAAWAGAFDGSGTKGALAMWSAAPLVRAALLVVADQRGAPLTLPPAPPGVVTHSICRLTGQLAGPGCAPHREHFVRGTEPKTRCAGHGHAASSRP